MNTYLIVDNNTNIILNGIVWDGNTANWQNPFANTYTIQSSNVYVGWTISGNTIVNTANTQEYVYI
jgi:hypothetical protein